jgi:hypothetical protein
VRADQEYPMAQCRRLRRPSGLPQRQPRSSQSHSILYGSIVPLSRSRVALWRVSVPRRGDPDDNNTNDVYTATNEPTELTSPALNSASGEWSATQ